MVDILKEMGFLYATKAGISIGSTTSSSRRRRSRWWTRRRKKEVEVDKQYREGLITNGERYNKVIQLWSDVTDRSRTRCSRRWSGSTRRR
jgi:DNA-directed RNA polymerase subunit beta'